MTGTDSDSALAAGTQGTPNPDVQQQSGQQSSGVDVAKLQKTLDALVKRQDEIDARTRSLQGDKDRDVKKTRKELDEIKRQFAEIEKMKASGMELDDAVEEVDFRQTVRDLKDQLSKLNTVSAQNAGNGASGAVEETQTILKQYELDPNDPAVLPLLSLKGADLKAASADLAFRRAKQPQPSSSSAPALQGGSVAQADLKALEADYRKELATIAGTQKGDSKIRMITELKTRFREKGLQVN